MSDDETTPLTDAVKSADRRVQLEAIRDYLALTLEGNRCSKCRNSELRSGDQAALVLRLTTVLRELQDLPVGGEEKSTLEKIRERARNVTGIEEAPSKMAAQHPRQSSRTRDKKRMP